jgi:hypothetical protein
MSEYRVVTLGGVPHLIWQATGGFKGDKFVKFEQPKERKVALELCPMTGKVPRLRYHTGKSKYFKTKYFDGKLSTKSVSVEGNSPQRLAEYWNKKARVLQPLDGE